MSQCHRDVSLRCNNVISQCVSTKNDCQRYLQIFRESPTLKQFLKVLTYSVTLLCFIMFIPKFFIILDSKIIYKGVCLSFLGFSSNGKFLLFIEIDYLYLGKGVPKKKKILCRTNRLTLKTGVNIPNAV